MRPDNNVTRFRHIVVMLGAAPIRDAVCEIEGEFAGNQRQAQGATRSAGFTLNHVTIYISLNG